MVKKKKNNDKGIWFNLKKVWYYLNFKCTVYSQQMGDKKENQYKLIGENIYGGKTTVKDYVKCQNRVHRWFKYKIFYPVFHLVKLFFGKYIVTRVPNKRWYRNMRVFDKAYEQTLSDLCWINSKPGDGHEKEYDGMRKSAGIKMLRDIKNIYLTLIKNDTYYFEMHNILMFNITREMHKIYGNDARVEHLFYADKSINDPRYFTLTGELNPVLRAQLMNILNSNGVKIKMVKTPKLDEKKVKKPKDGTKTKKPKGKPKKSS